MKALHFGAGNIGLGFVGKILSKSGFSTTFADVNQEIVEIINNKKMYSVQEIENNQEKIFYVKNINALNFNDPKVIQIIASVDLITTAVGPAVLEKIASTIALGIKLKFKNNLITHLNIISCENKIKASSFLKRYILKHFSRKYFPYFEKYIGFVDCTIDTIIPSNPNQNKKSLFLLVEKFQEWIVNKNQFKGTIPKIINMELSNNLYPFIERKLFTLNTGHAIAAYLGLIKKYKTMHEAISDKSIKLIVKSAMKESGNFLIKKHKFDPINHLSYINKIFSRFENPILSDNLHRIARNPLQKLGKKERLIKPFSGCLKYQLPCTYITKGIASVFFYKNEHDLESIKMSSLIKNKGIQKFLLDFCGFPLNSKETSLITSEYINIEKKIFN